MRNENLFFIIQTFDESEIFLSLFTAIWKYPYNNFFQE